MKPVDDLKEVWHFPIHKLTKVSMAEAEKKEGDRLSALRYTTSLCEQHSTSFAYHMTHNLKRINCDMCRVLLDREMECGNVVAREQPDIGTVFVFLAGPPTPLPSR